MLKIDPSERGALMKAGPATFYITDHYTNYPFVLVRLSTASQVELAGLLENAWRREAPTRLVEAYDRLQVRHKVGKRKVSKDGAPMAAR